MLASITPLGERGRRSNWRVTVTAFLVGATAAAAVAGAALGALGSIVLPARPGLAVLLVAIGVAIVLDGLPIAVPGPRRQVDERWLDRYRGWVYGVGYGAQLGLGVTTIVSSAATYVAVLAAFLTASAPAGAVVLGCFGAMRGLIPLATAGIRSQRQLLAFHRALARWRGPARWGAVAILAGTFALGLALL
jgi:sulfite exporter TauE/SafE